MIVKHCIIVMAVVTIALLSSCNRNSDTSSNRNSDTPGTAAAKQAANTSSPFLRVETYETHSFHGETKLHAWTLQGYGIKELTVRLLHISNGQSKVVNESVLTWNEATASKTTGRILFLSTDGQAFGAKGKRSFSLSVAFDDIAPNSGLSKSYSHLFEEVSGSSGRLTHSMNDGDIGVRVRGTTFLYRVVFLPPVYVKFSFTNKLDSLIEISKNGATIVAVTLDWKPK